MMIVVVVAVLAVGVIGGAVYEKSHANNYHCWPNVYGPATSGPNNCVKTIQRMVSYINVKYIGVDGYYGTQTKGAVRTFQLHHGLTGGDADGIVGPKTWGKLCTVFNSQVYNTYKAQAGCPQLRW